MSAPSKETAFAPPSLRLCQRCGAMDGGRANVGGLGVCLACAAYLGQFGGAIPPAALQPPRPGAPLAWARPDSVAQGKKLYPVLYLWVMGVLTRTGLVVGILAAINWARLGRRDRAVASVAIGVGTYLMQLGGTLALLSAHVHPEAFELGLSLGATFLLTRELGPATASHWRGGGRRANLLTPVVILMSLVFALFWLQKQLDPNFKPEQLLEFPDEAAEKATPGAGAPGVVEPARPGEAPKGPSEHT
jgi:hypothetical protein